MDPTMLRIFLCNQYRWRSGICVDIQMEYTGFIMNENKNPLEASVNNQPTNPDISAELSPLDQEILAVSKKITETENFIKELQSLPQTERTINEIAKAQEELANLIQNKAELLDQKFAINGTVPPESPVNNKLDETNPWNDATYRGGQNRGADGL